MARALVIRHGQSTWNAEGRWQGWSDPPLAPAGEEQAEAAGRVLPVVVDPGAIGLLVASDLRRAAATASILAGAAGVTAPLLTDAGWREYDVGAWSGLRRPEIAERWPEELRLWDQGAVRQAPGGEAWAAFADRVRASMGRVADGVGAAGPGQVALVVAHGLVISCLARLSGLEPHHVRHLSGYWVEASPSALTVLEAVTLLSPDGSLTTTAPVPPGR